jgi:hypothetical protein
MVKILDLSDALRLADPDNLPLPHTVHESKKHVNDIFATLHPDITPGWAASCAEGAKTLSVKEFEYLDHTRSATRNKQRPAATTTNTSIGAASVQLVGTDRRLPSLS